MFIPESNRGIELIVTGESESSFSFEIFNFKTHSWEIKSITSSESLIQSPTIYYLKEESKIVLTGKIFDGSIMVSEFSPLDWSSKTRNLKNIVSDNFHSFISVQSDLLHC